MNLECVLNHSKPLAYQDQYDQFQKDLERLESRIRLLNGELEDLHYFEHINSPKTPKKRTFSQSVIEPIPTGAPSSVP
jgi:hypothetical protein